MNKEKTRRITGLLLSLAFVLLLSAYGPAEAGSVSKQDEGALHSAQEQAALNREKETEAQMEALTALEDPDHPTSSTSSRITMCGTLN